MNKTKDRICEICSKGFTVKYPSYDTKTCSKECKNIIASIISKKQFTDENNRIKARENAIKQHSNPELRKKLLEGVALRNKRWQEQGFHPRKGKILSKETRNKISSSNIGKNKGKSWDEILGKEYAEIRRLQNSEHMAKTNEILLKKRISKTEKYVLDSLQKLNFKNNIKVGKYTADFINTDTNVIIEIHGNYWHCNPSLYEPEFFNRSLNMFSRDKWLYDINRTEYLENKGYKVYIIWENKVKEFIETLNTCSIEETLENYTFEKSYKSISL